MSLVPTATAVLNQWIRILGALEKKINRQSFETWLKPTRFSRMVGKTLYVKIPSAQFEHVGDKYADLIEEAIERLALDIDAVEFETPTPELATRVREDGGFAPVPSHSASAPRNGAGRSVAPGAEQARFDWNSASQLNPRYQFDGFVAGSGNQFALAAAMAVAERPSKAYNPLFLYGGAGMGKTHLMNAIGHEVKRRFPHAAISYVSGEKFVNELIDSLRYNKMTSFRDKFRSVDVLLVDDVQFLAGKERMQEEFFHTFNALHEESKQIVLASDRPPKELGDIKDRLRSRFEWGLIADIQPPDLETKVAILQRKAEAEHTRLPADVALFIASNVRTNVRELEGALIRVVALVLAPCGGVLTGGRAAVPEAIHRHAGAEDHDRGDSAGGGGAVRDAHSGVETEEQLATDRGASADCDVPGQADDGGFTARDRPPVRRQAPHHRDAFNRQDRRAAAVR